MRELPMFPLGTVVFPSMVLPLHVFERRYRTLIRHVLDADGEFGVVLIERGHEVGGGDVRTDLGTLVRIVRAEELEDGRWVVVAVGTDRLRVLRWLPDDPYPRAEVQVADEPTAEPEDGGARDAIVALWRRVLGLQAELGEPSAPVDTEVAEDPVAAAYQIAVLAPLGPLDAQSVLAEDTAGARLARLRQHLEELEALLRLRLGAGA